MAELKVNNTKNRPLLDWAGPLTEVVLLGNVALHPEMREELTMKKLLWDGPKMRFTNCDDANKFLKTEYRKGWNL